jgi:hypothetical protein
MPFGDVLMNYFRNGHPTLGFTLPAGAASGAVDDPFGHRLDCGPGSTSGFDCVSESFGLRWLLENQAEKPDGVRRLVIFAPDSRLRKLIHNHRRFGIEERLDALTNMMGWSVLGQNCVPGGIMIEANIRQTTQTRSADARRRGGM